MEWSAQIDNFTGNFTKISLSAPINNRLDKLPSQVIYNIIKYAGKMQDDLEWSLHIH